MKKMIFDFIEFFGSGHFLVIFLDVMDQKIAGAKNVIKVKNQFFHARKPREEIFEIHSYCGLSFMIEVWIFDFLFQDGGTFFQNFRLK